MREYTIAEAAAARAIEAISIMAFKQRHGMDAAAEQIAAMEALMTAIREAIYEDRRTRSEASP